MKSKPFTPAEAGQLFMPLYRYYIKSQSGIATRFIHNVLWPKKDHVLRAKLARQAIRQAKELNALDEQIQAILHPDLLPAKKGGAK